MTAVIDQQTVSTGPRGRVQDIWRIVRLHAVTPSVFFGIPWAILGGAFVVTVLVGVILSGADADQAKMSEGMRYSWAVLAPQWYLVAVGVQAVGVTLSFALGFGATRRDFWLGTALLFAVVSLLNGIAIATLVQVEKATEGWWIGIAMFDALWYGRGWILDFYTTFALQMLVLFIGASLTTVYLRWRMAGMLAVMFTTAAIVLVAVAALTWSNSWSAVFTWLGGLGVAGAFTVVLAFAAVFAVVGYLVIRRATPR